MSESKAKTQKFIVKFFPEVMVKGSKAKRQMIDQLYSNIKTILGRISKEIEYKKFFDKIEIVSPIEVVVEVRQKLLDTSGIELVLEALQFDNISTIDEMKEIVNKYSAKEIQGKTFVVRAKRSGEHEFKSTDMERNIGGFMLANNPETKGVALKNADVTINIELVHKQLNIITQKYQGLSGFPIGTQGDILSLMSGGFDSTIASYLTMKRGIKTHFVFFNLGGIAHEIGVKQVAYYLWNKFGSSHRVTFTSVPFEDVVTEIFNSTSQSYMGVTLKRLMLMASEKIADKMGIDALLTGESVAQVSSQTLRNLALIDEVTNKLVLRPLSTMNKPDIMEMANQIGTRRFAESMPEYCGVISKNPVTHGSFSRIEKEAKKFNYEVLDKAVEDAITINVDEIDADVNSIGQIDIISDISSGEYTIIDIRQSDDCIETSCETIKLPFFKLKTEFEKLPQEKQYLFYCDKGILSQLHAQYLIDSKGYKNIKVYRPQ
ncbi:tRNA uracil 4-sulfurtransferase ThiI [Halarcobacter bivalviorum]|uniref:tRNA sulfurtransferase n=1 Tax=Halarcobacter bivalviorum TaxID=663364 RepID=A0AAX2ABF7_9BACT|nr:tRNA uracil 4-sulfurtransferase ThiI [Halarcobacter bivalviorum]AXH12105.1 tRNA uridine 4-sulfurtransferase [Halarcobacter bivalviorum]RXK11214.1 tRNA 4-thiouridine(8) synthase ThiI [Halarcobacter bivalviorum]